MPPTGTSTNAAIIEPPSGQFPGGIDSLHKLPYGYINGPWQRVRSIAPQLLLPQPGESEFDLSSMTVGVYADPVYPLACRPFCPPGADAEHAALAMLSHLVMFEQQRLAHRVGLYQHISPADLVPLIAHGLATGVNTAHESGSGTWFRVRRPGGWLEFVVAAAGAPEQQSHELVMLVGNAILSALVADGYLPAAATCRQQVMV